MISKEETEYIAKLARLGLSESAINAYQKELSAILDYIEKLKTVNIDGIEPFTHAVEITNISRADNASKKQRADRQTNSADARFRQSLPEGEVGF